MTGHGRLPTFLVIGAHKAGTTSLAAWLAAHPDVFMAPQKEVRYFNTPNHKKGEAWYRSQFAGARGERAVGEATPLMAHPKAAMRIARLLPDARLVALLRDPAERAYSQWVHLTAVGEDRRPFAEAIAAEENDPTASAPGLGYPVGYLEQGRYLKQLLAFTEHFPRSRLHVLLTEDLRDDPEESFAAICRFLGVGETTPEAVGRIYNPRPSFRSQRIQTVTRRLKGRGRLAHRAAAAIESVNRRETRPYELMDAAMRARLVSWFKQDNADLADWLNRDLSAWMR